MKKKESLLLVANYDSDIGYAWWLMESFWAQIAQWYHAHHTVILAYPVINKLPKKIASAPLQVVEYKFSPPDLKRLLSHIRFIRKHRIKKLYLTDHQTTHWAYLFYRIFGVKIIVVHEHTPGTRPLPGGLKKIIKTWINRAPWITADAVIGATEFVRQRLIEINCIPPYRCFAAPNGLPDKQENWSITNLHDLFSIPGNRKILIMVSRAHIYKGISFILQCMAKIYAVHSNHLHFLFVGDGPDLENFKNEASQLKIAEYCTFVGNRHDVASLLSGADIAIHPSKGEVGYSLSILEYMRAGLPVIVPDNPSVCETIQHMLTGIIYPEDDINEATAAICQLLEDDVLRKQLGHQGQIMSRHYSLDSTHKALKNIFIQLDKTLQKS